MRKLRHDDFFSWPEQALVFPEAMQALISIPGTHPNVTDKTDY